MPLSTVVVGPANAMRWPALPTDDAAQHVVGEGLIAVQVAVGSDLEDIAVVAVRREKYKDCC